MIIHEGGIDSGFRNIKDKAEYDEGTKTIKIYYILNFLPRSYIVISC